MTRAVILAAGESKRAMTNKRLLPIGNETILQRLMRQLLSNGISDIQVTLSKDQIDVVWSPIKRQNWGQFNSRYSLWPVEIQDAGYEFLSNGSGDVKIIVPHMLIDNDTLVIVGDIVCSERTMKGIADTCRIYASDDICFSNIEENNWQHGRSLYGYYVKNSCTFLTYLKSLCDSWHLEPEKLDDGVCEVDECTDIDYIEDYVRALYNLRELGDI